MDEFFEPKEINIQEFMKPKCPVKVGDRIYRKYKNINFPDRMEVIEIIPHQEGYFIKIKYMYHSLGPSERTYGDEIFKDDSWVIERKGVDFVC